VFFAILSILLTCIIFYISVAPMHTLGISAIESNALVEHFLMYLIYGVVLWKTFTYRTDIKTSILFAVLVAVYMGTVMEIFQIFIPYRAGDIWDFSANTLGTLTGMGVIKIRRMWYG